MYKMYMQSDSKIREKIHDGLVEIMEDAGVPIDTAANIRNCYDRRDYEATVDLLVSAVGECQNRERSRRLLYIADIIRIAQRHDGI